MIPLSHFCYLISNRQICRKEAVGYLGNPGLPPLDTFAADYGLPARWLINHDSTFIAVLPMAQMPQPAPTTWSRHCRPFARPELAVAGNQAFEYAAAITLYGMRIKLQDTRQDESSLIGLSCVLVALLSRGMFTKAHTALSVDCGGC